MLLIVVSIYSYLIKYQAKQKHLLPFHDTNNEIKKFCLNNVLQKKWKVKKNYNILCKRLTVFKRLCIRFHKTDGFIRVYDGNGYLVLVLYYTYNTY